MERGKEGQKAFVIQKGSRIRVVPPDRFLRVKDPDVASAAAYMLEYLYNLQSLDQRGDLLD